GEHSETTLALWRQEWETERRGLLSKIADLENTTRKADAEREEQSRAIESMGAARRAELDEQHHAELTRLTDDRAAWEAACRRELQQWHGRADEAARKLSEMESALEIARASETRAHEAAHAEAALARQHAQEAEKRLAEARTHFDVMLANIEADRQRERQDFERLLAERDQAEAKVHEELRSTKLALEEADRRRLREMEEATADRFTAERALGEQARAAVNRVSELEKALADSEPVMRRAQQVLAEETERNRRYEQRFEEQKRHLEEREAAMLNELREREDELTRRAAEVEASAARTAADYRERRLELDKLKADFERHLGELVRKARG
ncbi:MAG: hypothetical protein NTX64_08025, partial [Elusimicrobia bacterium]|nr:hypothetical protein [Elusimicrobiota bacterium]